MLCKDDKATLLLGPFQNLCRKEFFTFYDTAKREFKRTAPKPAVCKPHTNFEAITRYNYNNSSYISCIWRRYTTNIQPSRSYLP